MMCDDKWGVDIIASSVPCTPQLVFLLLLLATVFPLQLAKLSGLNLAALLRPQSVEKSLRILHHLNNQIFCYC